MKQIIFLAIAMAFVQHVIAQNKVSGRVTAFNKYTLEGVKVEAKKSGNAVYTDKNGNYDIECKKKDALKISADGFMQARIKLDGSESYFNTNLIMLKGSSAQYKVVNKGYMTQDELDYALENLTSENNDFSRFQDICDLLQSKFPLVKCIEDNGINRIYLGSNPQSLQSGSWALLVVDGITTDEISGLSPMQVADIRVLSKEGASAYGVRGSNGVVEIDLKASAGSGY
ncbi:hypothetical protein [Saccharicrinis aurantiacus]|uniref:hypothetical protein n=1 Tax=Saccharicrinis aurantiacus TaxID=1849719 RepID=UPI00094FEEEF|nr:hypothetical protein [Saccharicrinis aurantiacus]